MYNYDRGGNILSKVKYAYTTGAVGTAVETIPYVYGDSNWKDKLTSYNGQTITYDAIGNPLNDGTWTYTWQAGRQLKQMSAEGTSVSFKYDHNGMRVQKVVEQSWYPEITNYTYHGKILTHMMVDYTDFDEVAHQDKLHFFYDAQSRPAKVSYNGAIYTYAHNLQGDVVGLLDSSGTLVVEYKYDAWGKLLSTTGTLADTLGKRNPFRYRGYVFDEETGLYYLRSRYYIHNIDRFLNADGYVATSEDLLASNMFIYCMNSPTMQYDPVGANCICLYQRVRGDHVCYSGPGYSGNNNDTFVLYKEYTSNARPSTKYKHEEGQSRKQRDARGEKGDSRRKEDRSNKRRSNRSKIVALGVAFLLVGAIAYVVANDVTGVGTADDGALVPLGAMLWDNLTLAFG